MQSVGHIYFQIMQLFPNRTKSFYFSTYFIKNYGKESYSTEVPGIELTNVSPQVKYLQSFLRPLRPSEQNNIFFGKEPMYLQDLWIISANHFELFATHSFKNSTVHLFSSFLSFWIVQQSSDLLSLSAQILKLK